MKYLVCVLTLLLSVNLYSQESKRSTIDYIPLKNVHGFESKKAPICFNSKECEQSYFTIKLTGFDISVINEKKLWKKYDPFLYIKIDVGCTNYIKIIKTNDIEKTTWDKNSSARSINNLFLIGPYPYKGENVTIAVNLYAYKTEDNLQAAIDTIGEFSNFLPTQVNAFVNVSSKVKAAIDRIIPNCRPLISYQATWEPQKDSIERPSIFKEGFYIIYPIDQRIDASNIVVNNLSQIKYKEGNKEIHLYEKHIDYIVLDFEHFIRRVDDQTFSFYNKYSEALRASYNGDDKEMEKKFEETKVLLFNNENYTTYNKFIILSELYKKLLLLIQNKKKSYKGNIIPPDPICYYLGHKDNDYQIIQSAIRENMIKYGLIQPSEQVYDYKVLLNGLDEKYKSTINNKIKNQLEYYYGNIVESILGNDLGIILNKDKLGDIKKRKELLDKLKQNQDKTMIRRFKQ